VRVRGPSSAGSVKGGMRGARGNKFAPATRPERFPARAHMSGFDRRRRPAWSHKPGRGTSCACVAISLLAVPALAHAQSREREPERIEPGLLHLHRVDAAIEVESIFERSRVRTDYGRRRSDARQTNRTLLTETVLTLFVDGDIVHPYLIDFRGSIGLGYSYNYWEEERFGDTDSDESSGYLTEFDLRADLFKNKRISGTVYGQRGEDRIPRLFLPTLRERRTAFGTAWVHKGDRFIWDLSFDHTDTERFGNRADRDDEDFVEDRFRTGVEFIFDQDQSLEIDYDYSRTERNFQGGAFDFETERHQVVVDYDLLFGTERRHRFLTYVRIQDESGDLARDLTEIGPRLILAHSDTLSTSYGYQYNREVYDGFEIDQHRADVRLTHQLYTNLTTTVDVFGLIERTEDDIETTQYGAAVDWQYTRSNDYGQFFAELRVGGNTENTTGNNGNRSQINESGTFRDPLPLYLLKQNAVPSTIIVTDVTGRILYLRGSDYTVTTVQNRVALLRVPSGRITNGQSVHIDYRYRTPADGEVDTVRVDVNLRQDFDNGWSPYYRFSFRDQDVNESAGFAFRADRTNHHRLGVRYARPRWSASAEYELYDDTFGPYNAMHLNGNANILRDAAELLDVRGSFSQYWFKEEGWDRDVSVFNIGAVHERRLDDYWTTTLTTTYRWEDDSQRGNTNAVDLGGVLAYRRGNMSLEFSVEYDLLYLPGSNEDGLAAWVNLRWAVDDVLRTQ